MFEVHGKLQFDIDNVGKLVLLNGDIFLFILAT